MIEAVRRIGDYIQDNKGGEDSLYKIIEDPDSNGKYKQVLVVALKEKEGNYSFSHVETQEFKEYTKYLYKGKQGNALDATPTSRITEVNKTFKKFLRWFDNYDNYPLSGEERESIRRMGEAIKAEHDKIQADLQDKFSRRKTGESSIITLGFDDGVNIKYLSDISIFRNVLLNKGSKGFSNKYGVESIGQDKMCSVCREVKAEVYGFAVPWSFHNYDKPGNISGGFEISESWKNTPICLNCATCLEAGKIYIEDKLDFSFYGFHYLLIPKLAIGGDIQEILTILGARDQKKEQKLNQEVEKRLTADEYDILDIVAKQNDFVSTSLMFYKKDKSSYSILLLIEGILPSRLSRLFSIKDSVDKRFKLYNDIALSESQKEKNHLVFNFGVVRRFFPSESAKGAFAKRSKNKTSDKMFMEMVNKIFGGNSIDYYLLIGFINERIREAFDGGYPTNVDTLFGFLLLHYLNDLGILKNVTSEMDNMTTPSEGDLSIEHLEGLPLEQKIKSFFESNEAFFGSDAKKAVFLEGILAQKLLNIQFTEKRATPFRDKLHGLRMNEPLIKRLLPEIQNKLEEYKKNYYRELEGIIARYFILSGESWKENNDDLSFYFVLGMNSHKLFKDAREEEVIEEVA